MQINRTTIDFRQARKMLDAGHQVMLFIRHSERPPICTEDKDFGRELGLTEKGVAMAVEAGSRFKGVAPVRFFTSPMVRCRLTAAYLAHGMGLENAAIAETDEIGIKGFYTQPDSYSLQLLMKERGYMKFMEDYLDSGSAPYLNPVGSSTRATLEWMSSVACEGLNVFVSHDMYITAFLTALNVRRFHGGDWIGFLHAAVVDKNPCTGEKRCSYAVPCLEAHREPAKFAH